MNKLSGKRLLILGGSIWKDAIKAYAADNNITLIATGSNQSAGIFDIANEKYDIDSTNSEEIKKLIKEQKIDGVYMGGSEPVITQACKYINELDLPCYCTPAQWEQLQDKTLFKELCIKFNLPVVPKYDVTFENIDQIIKHDDFPLITKPTDGCGSSGFSKCNNIDELKRGYSIATAASPTGSVIVEKFVNNKGVVVFYTFSNGKMYFSGVEDKYPVKHIKHGTFVGGLFVFESKLTNDFRSKFEEKLQMLFNSLGIKEGSVWIEVFYDNNQYYFNEVGYRYGGSVSIYPIDYLYSINQVGADIYYALTGESKIFDHKSIISPHIVRKSNYCIYPVHIAGGTIKSITGIEEIRKLGDIIFISVTKNIDDHIEDTGSFSQAFALIHFICNSSDECKNIIEKIHDTIHVLNENGEEMIMRMLDTNNIKF